VLISRDATRNWFGGRIYIYIIYIHIYIDIYIYIYIYIIIYKNVNLQILIIMTGISYIWIELHVEFRIVINKSVEFV